MCRKYLKNGFLPCRPVFILLRYTFQNNGWKLEVSIGLTWDARDKFERSQNSYSPQGPKVHGDVHVGTSSGQNPVFNTHMVYGH